MAVADLKHVVAWVGRSGKRIAISLVGFGLVTAGLILLALPGPGILVIIAGLAILATEYAWARRALDETKRRAANAKHRMFRRRKTQE